MKRIKVGDTYDTQMIFGWATVRHTVIERNGNKITERQEWIAEDSGVQCACEEVYDIKVDEKGTEYYVRFMFDGEEFGYWGTHED